jgi:hypothetical protein
VFLSLNQTISHARFNLKDHLGLQKAILLNHLIQNRLCRESQSLTLLYL